jgi:hypothetical protein
MGSMADMWPGERSGPRLLAAFAVSVTCHGLVLLGVRLLRPASLPTPPVV